MAARALAEDQRELTRLHSYVAEINVAAQAIQHGNLGPALRLLDRQIHASANFATWMGCHVNW